MVSKSIDMGQAGGRISEGQGASEERVEKYRDTEAIESGCTPISRSLADPFWTTATATPSIPEINSEGQRTSCSSINKWTSTQGHVWGGLGTILEYFAMALIMQVHAGLSNSDPGIHPVLSYLPRLPRPICPDPELQLKASKNITMRKKIQVLDRILIIIRVYFSEKEKKKENVARTGD